MAENPVRRGTLIVQVANVVLETGAKRDSSALNETLTLVCSGRVARECGAQIPLIDLLCDQGADLNYAISATLAHAEFEAVNALIRRGAQLDLTVAAAIGLDADARRLFAYADAEDRQRALALASQFGRTELLVYCSTRAKIQVDTTRRDFIPIRRRYIRPPWPVTMGWFDYSSNTVHTWTPRTRSGRRPQLPGHATEAEWKSKNTFSPKKGKARRANKMPHISVESAAARRSTREVITPELPYFAGSKATLWSSLRLHRT